MSNGRQPRLVAIATSAVAADSFVDDLKLETHGFVSFGYLKSWGNNWLGETLDGTDESWEAAANVIAQPMDRLSLGAQLFTRDLGIYGNARVELDWAYADWRIVDGFAVQLERVKLPLGLHSDEIDVAAARPAVFLPRSFIYPVRSRDILMSTDVGKPYGTGGPLDCHATIEGIWDDPSERHGSPYSQNAVAAITVMPTTHWSLKCGYRYMHGTKDLDANLNPGGVDPDAHVVALKTTVDFCCVGPTSR